MTMQVADVSKVLASTGKVCDAGNIQVFTKEGGFIISEKAAQAAGIISAISRAQNKIGMKRSNGVYKYDIWIKRKGKKGGMINTVREGTDKVCQEMAEARRQRQQAGGNKQQPFVRLGEELI